MVGGSCARSLRRRSFGNDNNNNNTHPKTMSVGAPKEIQTRKRQRRGAMPFARTQSGATLGEKPEVALLPQCQHASAGNGQRGRAKNKHTFMATPRIRLLVLFLRTTAAVFFPAAAAASALAPAALLAATTRVRGLLQGSTVLDEGGEAS